MKKLLIVCFLTTGCAVFESKTFQGFRGIAASRGPASVSPADLLCKRLRISREKRDNCLHITRHYEISDSVVSICANLETSPEQKVDCLEVVAGKKINETVVSACANWQASPNQTIHFLGAVAGKEISSFAVTMCEKLWKTAQQRMNCVLESNSPPSPVIESSHQNQGRK